MIIYTSTKLCFSERDTPAAVRVYVRCERCDCSGQLQRPMNKRLLWSVISDQCYITPGTSGFPPSSGTTLPYVALRR